MKKDIWLKPGKELNTGAIIGGIGFAILYRPVRTGMAGTCAVCGACLRPGGGIRLPLRTGLPGKDKDSVSYNIVWGTGALAILMLLPAVMTIIKG